MITFQRAMLVAAALCAFAPGTSFAAGSESTAELGFVLSTFLLLISGLLIVFMAGGFSMLEAGFVRVRNVAMQLTKNVALVAVATLMYFLIGHHLMQPDGAWTVDGIVGVFQMAAHVPVDLEGVEIDHSQPDSGAKFFFLLMFCATAASIVSGSLAERIRLLPFLAFIAILTGLLYPIQASWTWGGGILSDVGFKDFAGATLVHSAGGWAALAGVLILGPRIGKYDGERINPLPASNLTLATLGVFMLWIGWFGFNGGSLFVLHDDQSASNLARVFINTELAATGGAFAAMVLSRVMFRSVDLTLVLNGSLAGLVAITAEPLWPSMGASFLIGAIAGGIVVIALPWLETRGIDDVVGAIPVHLFAGIWGSLAVAFTHPEANIVSQGIGIAATGTFMFSTSLIVWVALRYTIGLRLDEEAEEMGLDLAELGTEAYPEFSGQEYGR